MVVVVVECGALGEMRGRLTFARAQLANLDAGRQMAVEPITAWARAV